MALSKVAGSKIYIGGRVSYLSTVTITDFAGQTWTEIDGFFQSGDIGSEQETITQTLINRNTTIYSKGVISFPPMQNIFVPLLTDSGQIAFAAAQRSCKPYAFKVEWSADCGEEGDVTISNASPAIVSWTGHGLAAGTPVSFLTTGALPTGLTAGTTYYIVSPTTDAFSVAATPGGSAIGTSSAGSGIHTAYAQEVGETDLFYGFAMYGLKTGGDGAATRTLNMPIQPISNKVTV